MFTSPIKQSPFQIISKHSQDRTILLTNIDGFDVIEIKTIYGTQINNDKFTIYSNNPSSIQKFNWEVKAVRKDVERLEVEIPKDK